MCPPSFSRKISTHALREEGDPHRQRTRLSLHLFLPTPSARRATAPAQRHQPAPEISTHALREEGDGPRARAGRLDQISTHALREEGDMVVSLPSMARMEFLPTPSARRATATVPRLMVGRIFLPTPSARRATPRRRLPAAGPTISTHALREEGDQVCARYSAFLSQFLPTPSARRATCTICTPLPSRVISTHALREEGDAKAMTVPLCSHRFLPTPSARRATVRCDRWRQPTLNFYPRPPRGGRLRVAASAAVSSNFYPRPPRGGRRAPICWTPPPLQNFYPRPPRGGRRPSGRWTHRPAAYFYPRPPRGGRPASPFRMISMP